MMKNTLIIFAILTALFLSFIYGVATVNYRIYPFELLKEFKQSRNLTTTYSEYFYNKKLFFERFGQQKYDAVFIGDSITDRAEWGDLFPSLKIANRGISKDTTEGLLTRLDSIHSTSAPMAFIMIGINDFDLGYSVDEVFNNYKTIIESLSNSNIHIFIQSTILAGKRKAYLNEQIGRLNTKLYKLSIQSKLYTYIDLNSALAPNGLLNDIYTRDGVHLNAKGYAAWRNIINPFVNIDNSKP